MPSHLFSNTIAYRFGLETCKPGFEFEDHVVMILEALAIAPAMTACGIDMDGGGYIVFVKLLIVVQAIGGRHSLVVIREGEEGTRGGAVHLQVVAEVCLQLTQVFLRVAIAQEVIVGPFVGKARIHRDNRIEENLEVRGCIARGMGGNSRSEMTSRREAHDADVVTVDMPLDGVPADCFYGLLSIGDGDETVAMRHAVLQYNEGDTLVVEERGPLMTLMIHRQMGIATSRTADHSATSSLLFIRQIDYQFCLVFIVSV